MTSMHGFDLLREEEIPELNTRARLFRHQRTGAELLSLENEDENKLFGIAFRTPPPDSTGLPHILEHSVLCGSRKYPLKEPFVELLKGSLQTFLNALTFPDKTCYPVASQNLQDFYNLIDVYLDAVFYPRITPDVLQQEGWHYELEQLDEPLRYKGVVFNEMKGYFSSPDRLLGDAVQESLYPDTPYGLRAGGDPEKIPDLTYEQFKQFHEEHYHPSNARIVFYGDDDPAERLRIVDAYLSEFEPHEVDTAIPLQPAFETPRHVVKPYPVSEGEADARKGMATVGWVLPESTDFETVLSFHILEYILIGAPASPLRKALIDSGLGEDLTGGGLEADLRQMLFSTGLRGIDPADAGKVESLILETLEWLVREGIEQDMIEAAVNSTEFELRENNTGAYPRGLLLMLRALQSWLYDGDPLAPLAFEAPLNRLKQRLASGERIFETLIEEHFLQNSHRSTVVLEPDPDLAARVEKQEREQLEAARAGMSETALQETIEKTRELKLAQETPDPPEKLALIPNLQLEDLDRRNKVIPLEQQQVGRVKTLYHDLFTNGILYLDLGLNLRSLPQALLPYTALFGRVLLEMGTEREDYVRLSRRIARETGGIQPAPLVTTVDGHDQGATWLFLRGKAMVHQVEELLTILREVLLTVQLDNRERFRQILLEEKAQLEAGLAAVGHRIINRRLRARFDEAGWVTEQVSGISQLFFLRDLAQQVESDWPAVRAALEEIRDHLLNRNGMLFNVTVDAGNWQTIAPKLDAFAGALPAGPLAAERWSPDPLGDEGLSIPAQVNYVGKAADLYGLGFERDGAATVVTRYLRTTWLWDRVRVQGGAYGGFAVFDPLSGVFSYLSYRDPNLLGTLEIYDRTSEFLRTADISRDELTKSIIGAIGDMDTYMLPDTKGWVSLERYLAGYTDEKRQQQRDEILSTTVEDFRNFADVLDTVKEHGGIVVMGAAGALEAANPRLNNRLVIRRVL